MTAYPPGHRVAGADLALAATGWADYSGWTCTFRPPHRLKRYARHNWVAGELVRILNADRADLVILEDYAPSSFGINSTIAAAELGGIVRSMLERGGIRFALVKPNSLKKYATGDGRAKKPAMIAAAYEAGATLTDLDADNEADAWLLRHAGRAALGDVEPLGPLPASLAHLAPNG